MPCPGRGCQAEPVDGDPVNDARDLVAELFPRAVWAVLAGSVTTTWRTAGSDLDIVVLRDSKEGKRQQLPPARSGFAPDSAVAVDGRYRLVIRECRHTAVRPP